MEKFIVDTNFFFNLEIKSGFGVSPKEIMSNFSELIKKLKIKKKAEFYMPPLVVDELLGFAEKEKDYINSFLENIIIKAPDINNLLLSAAVFRQLIKEQRQRSYQGMKVAEEVIGQAASYMLLQSNLSKIDYQKQIGEFITKLRQRYRQATRVKFLDSAADFDIIALAKEINGQIITSDEGILIWGRKLGVKEIMPQLVKSRLTLLAED